MELPPQTVELIERYLAEYRGHLIGEKNRSDNPRYLFPKFNGQAKSGKVIAGSVCETLQAELGLDFHFHLFRQLGCFLYLKNHPDGFEVMRRVLAHRQIETTVRFYAEIQQSDAFREFDRAILSLRTGKPPSRRPGATKAKGGRDAI